MKVAVIGSRTFTDKNLLFDTLKSVNDARAISLIISGGAKGADSLAEEFADGAMIPKKVIKPDYAAFKGREKMAPKARNDPIIKDADLVVAFWDYKSPGTKDALQKAATMRKPILIIPFKEL